MSIRHNQTNRSLGQDKVANSKEIVPQEDIDRGEKFDYRGEDSHVVNVQRNGAIGKGDI
jgi:hypothetical protein